MTLALLLVFGVGYMLITLEHTINLNKTATALITGVICWAIYALMAPQIELVVEHLRDHLADIAEILFFLMGAMTVVELIDAHDGFSLITDRIASRNTRTLLWIICLLTFFLSALLDNLTTAIVMVSVLRKLVSNTEQRLTMAGMVIVAANAGGAWSPIGDVTTTMLWIGGQISASAIIQSLLLPSLAALLVPLIIITYQYTPNEQSVQTRASRGVSRPYITPVARRDRRLMLAIGLGAMLYVPIFKTVTHLPPYMGMLLALGAIWVASELIHKDKDESERRKLTASYALSRIDTPSMLFFLGILLAVGSLDATGVLHSLASSLDNAIGNTSLIVLLIGVASAVVDNVPIVAAAMGMYDLTAYPIDSALWSFLAYCAGTGGSLLVIGSAAGVAVMGLENITFGWYLRRISWLALLGYLAGAGVYLAQTALLG